MTDYFGYLVAPLMFIITIPFFLLEKTAIHLQNPFNNNKTDINVTGIASTIELNIHNMLNEPFEKQPNPEDGDFYVM
jgi:putative membrane protein